MLITDVINVILGSASITWPFFPAPATSAASNTTFAGSSSCCDSGTIDAVETTGSR
jgi:hypothetical protein